MKVVVKQVWARDCGLKKQCAEGFGDFGFWIVDSVDCGLEKHRAKGINNNDVGNKCSVKIRVKG